MHSTDSQQEPINLGAVFEVLSGDLNTSFAPLQQSMESPDEEGNYSFDATAARTYVNVAFVCIASVTTCMRQWATAQLQDEIELIEIQPKVKFTIGPFTIEAIRVTHSLVDCVALAVETPVGVIIHTGDTLSGISSKRGHAFLILQSHQAHLVFILFWAPNSGIGRRNH